MIHAPGRFVLLSVGLLLAIATAGCERSEAIVRYTVDKPRLPETKDRTLGAIVPLASQGWFFKLTGPKDAVAAQFDAFSALLKSVHFSDEAKPQWTLPEGWQERPGSDIRFATLVIGDAGARDGKPLEVSVTVLPRSGDEQKFLLDNINRWARPTRSGADRHRTTGRRVDERLLGRRDGHGGESRWHRGIQGDGPRSFHVRGSRWQLTR